MKRLLILAALGAGALVAGIAIAAAATGGGAAKNGAATVSVKTIGGAKVLVDAKGRALYVNDQERRGMVLCTGGCLTFWKPLTVTGKPTGGSLPGKLAVATRPDGRRQVAYNGKLLYSFTIEKPGKVTGDNVKDAFGGRHFTWHVVHPTKSGGSSGGGTTATTPYPGY